MSNWFEKFTDSRALDFEGRRADLERERREKLLRFVQSREEKADRIERKFYEELRQAQALLVAILAEQATVEVMAPQAPPVGSPSKIQAEKIANAPRPSPIREQVLKGIQPTLLWLLFRACHGLASMFTPFQDGKKGGLSFTHGPSRLSILHADLIPLEMRNIERSGKTARDEWIKEGTLGSLERLDETTWDVAIWLLVTFFIHGDKQDASQEFEAWITHYFDWRGTAASNRSAFRRQEVAERIILLTELHIKTDAELRQRNEAGGRRQKRLVSKDGGPFLGKATPFSTSSENREVAGFRIALGEWAKPYVEETAMLGVYYRRLAEYDHRREAWERQMGWYIVSQMQAQGSRMKFQVVNGQVEVTPQQPLRMQSILDGAVPTWINMAKNDPGKVIRQFEAALVTLKQDQIIGDFQCIDGPVDGANLPKRGRLQEMLHWRYMIYPGPDMVEHLRAKQTAASQAKSEAAKQRGPSAKTNSGNGEKP